MGYCGAANLNDLRARAEFIEITSAGLKESHPQDATLLKKPRTITAGLKKSFLLR
jgi:IMP dehydrogenase